VHAEVLKRLKRSRSPSPYKPPSVQDVDIYDAPSLSPPSPRTPRPIDTGTDEQLPDRPPTTASRSPSPPMETPGASRAQTRAPEEAETLGRDTVPKYDGDVAKYREWSQKAKLYLFKALQKQRSEAEKLATLLGALEGSAFTTVTRGDIDNCIDLETGAALIQVKEVFKRLEARHDGVISQDEAIAKLQLLRQGGKDLATYTGEFEELWAVSKMVDNKSKARLYFQGLSFAVRNPLSAAGFMPEQHEFSHLWKVVSTASTAAAKKNKDDRKDSGQGKNRGRGKGKGGQARGRGSQTKDDDKETRTCFYCDRAGHVKADCRKYAADQKNKASSSNNQGGGRGKASGRQAQITTGNGEDRRVEEIYSDDE